MTNKLQPVLINQFLNTEILQGLCIDVVKVWWDVKWSLYYTITAESESGKMLKIGQHVPKLGTIKYRVVFLWNTVYCIAIALYCITLYVFFHVLLSFIVSIILSVTQGILTSSLVSCPTVCSSALITVNLKCSHLPFGSALFSILLLSHYCSCASLTPIIHGSARIFYLF